MTRRLRYAPFLTLLTVALVVGAAAVTPEAGAQSSQQFAEAELFLELNDTDGDLGIHASIDGQPWTELEVWGPENGAMLDISIDRELRSQGLTQLSFESAEPSFDELNPAAFFLRFPEGRYRITGRSQTAGRLENTAVLSHVLAAPPANVTVNRTRAADGCDGPLPTVIAPVLIDWDPVTRSHPEIGQQGPIAVDRYQLFVQGEGVDLGLDLAPTVTEFEIPRGLTDRSREFKFEIIVRTASGNNTAVESCFRLR